MSNILEGLNEPQRQAVTTVEGPLMVIAGAGSGKTRVLTHRIAYMIQEGVNPFTIMALTFTNKAADEMKERITRLINSTNAKNVWMGTFHSVFLRILRVEAQYIGFTKDLIIYDTDDQKQIINAIVKDRLLDPKVYNARTILHRISMAKSALMNADDYCQNLEIQQDDARLKKPLIGEIFKEYSLRLQRSNAMDFDDILYFTCVLFRDNPEVLYKYQKHFNYFLVDEYQDTNFAQYYIVRRLAARHENLCVVGDDAQSIYSFRGANIQNILNFRKDYPDHKIIRLEQNYRSTKTIVKAANAIIANNVNQIKKTVWSDKEEGELITILHANSDTEEGTLVANSIFGYKMSQQLANKDFAILYRTNAQSRAMEMALRKQDIKYKIYGGTSFYDRKEVKDLLGYFRLVVNPNDDIAFQRIINTPTRGIGDTTKQRLIIAAKNNNCSIWQLITNPELPKICPDINNSTVQKLQNFALMIQSFIAQQDKLNAFDLAKHICDTIGYIRVLKEDDTPEGISRVQNVEELLNAIMEFSDQQYDDVTGEREEIRLSAFMQDVALLSDIDDNKKRGKDNDDDVVKLMTIHSAKGLEFPYVYVVGLEENLFPGIQSLSTQDDLEEERRLFYVAVTRAQKKLILSHAESRYRNGNLSLCEPSRFIDEIDQNLIEKTQKASFGGSISASYSFSQSYQNNNSYSTRKTFSHPTTPSTTPIANMPQGTPANVNDIQVGMRVVHAMFGEGTVLTVEGQNESRKACVKFDTNGERNLILKFAKLIIIK